jgi:hypothetical protein
MPELIQTLKSKQKAEHSERKFLAAMQGVELEDNEEKTGPTFEDIKARALGIDTAPDDVVSLQGSLASDAGFGIGAGLGYSRE